MFIYVFNYKQPEYKSLAIYIVKFIWILPFNITKFLIDYSKTAWHWE